MGIEFIPKAGACLATGNVLDRRAPVRWMLRKPSADPVDNGWRIMSSIDTTEYLNTRGSWQIVDFNDVCMIEPALIGIWDLAVGSDLQIVVDERGKRIVDTPTGREIPLENQYVPPAMRADRPAPDSDRPAPDAGGAAPAPAERVLRLDGTQLLPRDHYCVYRGRVFRCSINSTRIELFVSPGEPIPDGFTPADRRGSFVQSVASRAVFVGEVDAFYRVITTCWYKGDSYSIRRIDGRTLRLHMGGGRRTQRVVPEPPRPTLNELAQLPTVDIFDREDNWATIDIAEAARVTMAIVPYRLVDGYPKPLRDVTGAGCAVPAADEIFYLRSPADSPYLPPGQALAVAERYLAERDLVYPTAEVTPQRLRDGWWLGPAGPVATVCCVADDGEVLTVPADVSRARADAALTERFRARHPLVDPPPAQDSGTDIFD